MEQVVVCAAGHSARDNGNGNEQVGVQVYGVETGAPLSAFKRNKTCAGGCAVVPPVLAAERGGRGGYVVASQQDKPFVHLWKWDKCDVPTLRCSAPERLGPMLVDGPGSLLFGGGKTGKLMVWDLMSGELIRLWPGHLRAVTCLVKSDDDSLVVSAGEDAVIKVWRTGELVDSSSIGFTGNRIQPMKTLAGHTLPVTGMYIGSCGADARLISCSLDHSCKIWCISTGKALVSIAFPSALLSVSMDPIESTIFVGAVDGKIYANRISGIDSVKGSRTSRFEGHEGAVRGLAVSMDGNTLVSGSEDSTIRFWNIDSRQCYRTIQTALCSVASLSLAFKKDVIPSSAWKSETKSRRAHSSTALVIPPLAKYMSDSTPAKSPKNASLESQAIVLSAVPENKQNRYGIRTGGYLHTINVEGSKEDDSYIPITGTKRSKPDVATPVVVEKEDESVVATLRAKIQELEESNSRYKQMNKELLQQVMSEATA